MKSQDHIAMKEAAEGNFRMGRNQKTGAWRLEDRQRFTSPLAGLLLNAAEAAQSGYVKSLIRTAPQRAKLAAAKRKAAMKRKEKR